MIEPLLIDDVAAGDAERMLATAPSPAATPHTQSAVDAWVDVRAAADARFAPQAWKREPRSGLCADATSIVIRAAIALGQSLPPLPRRT